MGIASLIVTITLAFSGYLATYFNDLRLTKRKERIELINKKINDFYGPLYIASKAGKISYETLLNKMEKAAVFDPENPPTSEDLKEWMVWSKNVFMPLNEFRESLILENAYLLEEEVIPDCIVDFVTHVSAFKAIIGKWEMGDCSEYTPFLDMPEELVKYAEKHYLALKTEQLNLIGSHKGDRIKS